MIFNKKILIILSIGVIMLIILLGSIFYRCHHANNLTAISPVMLTQLYDNKDSKYSINYPSDWEYDIPGPGTVVFSGKQGTPAFYSTVNIQTVLTKSTGGDYSTVEQFVADIKNQAIKQFEGATFLDHGPIQLPNADHQELKGEYIVFTYKYNNILFKQRQIVVLRQDNQVFYAWAYTSPVEEYDTDFSIAKAMLFSWTIY